jgi:hypothetical protein
MYTSSWPASSDVASGCGRDTHPSWAAVSSPAYPTPSPPAPHAPGRQALVDRLHLIDDRVRHIRHRRLLQITGPNWPSHSGNPSGERNSSVPCTGRSRRPASTRPTRHRIVTAANAERLTGTASTDPRAISRSHPQAAHTTTARRRSSARRQVTRGAVSIPARSTIALSRSRSWRFARRIAAATIGADSLAKPAGSPRLRKIIRVRPSPTSSHV